MKLAPASQAAARLQLALARQRDGGASDPEAAGKGRLHVVEEERALMLFRLCATIARKHAKAMPATPGPRSRETKNHDPNATNHAMTVSVEAMITSSPLPAMVTRTTAYRRFIGPLRSSVLPNFQPTYRLRDVSLMSFSGERVRLRHERAIGVPRGSGAKILCPRRRECLEFRTVWRPK